MKRMPLQWVIEHQLSFINALCFVMMDLTNEVSENVGRTWDLLLHNVNSTVLWYCTIVLSWIQVVQNYKEPHIYVWFQHILTDSLTFEVSSLATPKATGQKSKCENETLGIVYETNAMDTCTCVYKARIVHTCSWHECKLNTTDGDHLLVGDH